MNGFAVSSPSSRIGARSTPECESRMPRSSASLRGDGGLEHGGVGLLALDLLLEPRDAFSRVCRSASISSALMVSRSFFGLTSPSTCTTSSSVKPRTTWAIASASRMFARNWLPSPSPSLAPRTMPAMSTNDTVAGRMRSEWKISASFVEPGVGQAHDADVRLDRRERVVRREHVVLGQRVEQGGLADVGQADDADSESHGSQWYRARCRGPREKPRAPAPTTVIGSNATVICR